MTGTLSYPGECSSKLRLHSLCIPQGGVGGGQRIFFWSGGGGGGGLKILKGIRVMVKISESRKGDANFFRSH